MALQIVHKKPPLLGYNLMMALWKPKLVAAMSF